MKTLRWAFAVLTIFGILAFIACGGDDGNGDEIKTVAQPTADPEAGSYTAEQTVTLECATNGADIYYSLDGATPGTLYSGEITISTSTTLKALAKKSGMNDSTVLTAVYTINIAPKTLTGNISISPPTAFIGEELSATYSGSEAVNYQWNKDETPIGGKTTNKLTPNEAGSYTVTVSLAGYNSKTSTAVVVTIPELRGDVTITGNAVGGGILTAEISNTNGTDESKFTYQWTRDGENIPNETNRQYEIVDDDDFGTTLGVDVGYEGMTGTISGFTSQVTWGVYGIPVTGTDNPTHIAIIKAGVDVLTEWGFPNHVAYIKNNVQEFRIIPSGGSTWVGIDDEKLIVKVSLSVLGLGFSSADEIGDAMWTYADSQGITQ